mmetsp:Transcript_58155/g.173548  ORF Transcript_58155/g.173548 Transcript_58155/m.173548 type:complete len:526 (-) Transcript_58155:118-1695(-)|eukprot:CAMPEP_0113596734 /NCGR_PEP_ID=MMETSP0015_2-20120614/40520_1 /TAXON_ID=2838 /ORGANISM="Odontella" /LENGTH=525 /DNA_ID=CAMNT_0000504321 /DNA_START=210 /DNA_END=1787 /DNA_ORIENTATION=- /assembly_acc=CAM_ASM_000160
MRIPQTALSVLILGSALRGHGAEAFGGPSVGRISFSTRSSASAAATTSTHSSSSRGTIVPSFERRTSPALRLAAADDDDDEDDHDEDYDEEVDPLGKGIDSVGWLPSTLETSSTSSSSSSSESISSIADGSTILPLFPLGGIVYVPNSEHLLNIFEPRYRQMYNDILMNGTKRFVVSMSHPTKEGSFAEMGVLFQLEDLKEVSEQTGDKIKYICNHKVTGRVKIGRILNPDAWQNRDTYLKVEGAIFDDSDGGTAGEDDDNDDSSDGASKEVEVKADGVYSTMSSALTELGLPVSDEEKALQQAFTTMVDLQHDLQEDVRFTRASIDTLGVVDGAGEGSLWNTIRLWQSYAEQRLVARQNDMQREFQEKLLEFLMKEKGVKEEDVPSAIGFQDLSPELQAEVQELQRRMAVELQPLVLESTLTMQKILEAEDHTARVNLLRHFMDAERKRLVTKKTLQGVFTGSPGSITAEPVVTEEGDDDSAVAMGMIEKAMGFGDDDDDEEGDEEETPSQPSSIFMDEPDAFQ